MGGVLSRECRCRLLRRCPPDERTYRTSQNIFSFDGSSVGIFSLVLLIVLTPVSVLIRYYRRRSRPVLKSLHSHFSGLHTASRLFLTLGHRYENTRTPLQRFHGPNTGATSSSYTKEFSGDLKPVQLLSFDEAFLVFPAVTDTLMKHSSIFLFSTFRRHKIPVNCYTVVQSALSSKVVEEPHNNTSFDFSRAAFLYTDAGYDSSTKIELHWFLVSRLESSPFSQAVWESITATSIFTGFSYSYNFCSLTMQTDTLEVLFQFVTTCYALLLLHRCKITSFILPFFGQSENETARLQ